MMRHLRYAFAVGLAAITLGLTSCSGINIYEQDRKTITIAEASGYDDDVAVTRLWKHLLEQKGYIVEIENLDLAPGFAGMARGDIDAYTTTWLPTTHQEHVDKFKDQLHVIEPDDPYYDNDRLVLAVPDFVDARTISDITAQPDRYDKRIVGIEPGSGQMEILRNELMPKYGMEQFDLVDGSTPAMLAALEKAVKNGDPTVVALWTPHWAFKKMPVRALQDDRGAWPDAEGSHVVVSNEFKREHPKVVEWFSRAHFTDAQLTSLMADVSDAEDPDAGVRKWLASNRDVVQSWTRE